MGSACGAELIGTACCPGGGPRSWGTGMDSEQGSGRHATAHRVGSAWAVPALVVAAPAPASAVSPSACTATVTLVNSTVMAGGTSVDLYLRDSKNQNSASTEPAANPAPAVNSSPVLNLTFSVATTGGAPIAGLVLTIAGDETRDSENNYMIGFSPTSVSSGFGESSTKKTASVTTSATGTATVKVSTATYNNADCGFLPRFGTFTVSMMLPCGSFSQEFTYQVYDGLPHPTNCP